MNLFFISVGNSDDKHVLRVCCWFLPQKSEFVRIKITWYFNGKFVKYIVLCSFKWGSQMTWLFGLKHKFYWKLGISERIWPSGQRVENLRINRLRRRPTGTTCVSRAIPWLDSQFLLNQKRGNINKQTNNFCFIWWVFFFKLSFIFKLNVRWIYR